MRCPSGLGHGRSLVLGAVRRAFSERFVPLGVRAGTTPGKFTSDNKDSQHLFSMPYKPGVLLCYLHIISFNPYHNPVSFFITIF